MRVLAIETSCDETSVAVVERMNSSVKVASEATASSIAEHAEIGGIIPEKAARRQLEYILPVIEKALFVGDKLSFSDEMKKFDRIAVTQGPGLIGSLLVGVETAKTLSFVFDIPIIPVNHLLAHLYANFIDNFDITLPGVGLIASGGHTDLLLFESHEKYKWLGGTRDDAVGEAIDKIGRLMGLKYPGGPEIEKLASKSAETKVKFKSPLIKSDDYDFSYSGLKSEAARYIEKAGENMDKEEIAYSVQKSAVDVLVTKTIRAAVKFGARSILVGGGVAANQYFRKEMNNAVMEKSSNIGVFFPVKKYAGDNASMIGAFACFHPLPTDFRKISADPDLYFA